MVFQSNHPPLVMSLSETLMEEIKYNVVEK